MIRSGYSKKGVAKGATGPASMHLPQHVYDLFDPRPPLEFVKPADNKVRKVDVAGVSGFLKECEQNTPAGDHTPVVIQSLYKMREEMKLRKKKEKDSLRKLKLQNLDAQIAERLKTWDPHKDEENRKTKNAYNTVFVCNINKTTSDSKLKSHFEKYGRIKQVVVIKQRHYAFIEYESERDFKNALKMGNRTKLDGKTLRTDVERGRTVKGWKPKSLGGGLKATHDRYPQQASDTRKRTYNTFGSETSDNYKRRRN